MARLNEPPLTSESFETLRLKLKRQNRDLARINSTQSLRIRGLENECARLLSENLDLRGQIIRLEKEAENNKSQRIADHALEIKEKLEAQLIEWGSMLASLGMEPPRKRHSYGRSMTKPRSSFSRPSPPQRRLRDIAKDQEALAQKEGRLPPIMENKSYPRPTMDQREIMALCSEATESADSSDLGPPPVSRFVDDAVKVESPSEPAPKSVNEAPPPKTSAVTTKAQQPVLSTEPKLIENPDIPLPQKEAASKPRPLDDRPIVAPVAAKLGAKRKYAVGEDMEPTKLTRPTPEPSKSKASTDRAAIARDRQNLKSLKEITAIRREARERFASSTQTRKPLSVKSTNDDVTSPKKVSKAGNKGEIKAEAKMEVLKERPTKEQPTTKSTEAKIEVLKERSTKEQPTTKSIERAIMVILPPPSSTLPIVSVPGAELEPAVPDVHLLSPCSPEPPASAGGHDDGTRGDTPPPADISLLGETSRASRRPRSAISYAEPNLRDKMRRPTKELFDAVAGEGKYIRTHQKTDEAGGKRESSIGMADVVGGSTELRGQHADARREPESPLAGKTGAEAEGLPSNVVMHRRKRSSIIPRDCSSAGEAERRRSEVPTTREDRGAEPREGRDDPYEFTSTSPTKAAAAAAAVSAPEKQPGRRQSKSVRRLSSVVRDDLIFDQGIVAAAAAAAAAAAERPKSTAGRKRASMAVPRRARVEADDDSDADATYSPDFSVDAAAAKDRSAMRRRSHML